MIFAGYREAKKRGEETIKGLVIMERRYTRANQSY